MNRKYLFFAILFLCLSGIRINAQDEQRQIYIASWNVENLFDTIDDPLKNDQEFLPEGSKKWNYLRLESKINNLAKVIMFMNKGRGPDILGMEEVENINVVKMLIYKLPQRDYIVVHRESPDKRGIDNALIYDRNIFGIKRVQTIPVNLSGNRTTRDILLTELTYKETGDSLTILVNHWPSRAGGQERSEPNRILAANTLKHEIQNLVVTDRDSNIVMIGDFNDDPDNQSINEVLKARKYNCNDSVQYAKEGIFNLSYKDFGEGTGSYLYRGNWNMLDQIIVTNNLIDGKEITYDCDSFEIIKPIYMISKEGRYKNSAIPTYGGKKYLGGYSDHFPVGARFFVKNNK